MKNYSYESEKTENLLKLVPLFLEMNLEDAEIEQAARALLDTLKQRMVEMLDAYVDEEGCVSCLHLSLISVISPFGSGEIEFIDLSI